MNTHLTVVLIGGILLAGCAEEPPPRSVTEFLDNPMLLEAAMIRCAENRSKTRYDQECVNARLAVARIQAREEAAGRAALEASSERKREALRRTQAAAAEARRRAAEAERRREEAEYLSQFGVEPPDDGRVEQNTAGVPAEDREPATEDGARVADPEPALPDLESVREELKRRNDQGGD